MHQTTQDNPEIPPPYELAPNQQYISRDSKQSPVPAPEDGPGNKLSTPPFISGAPVMIAGPSYIPQQHGVYSPTIYHYVNPRTGEHATSLLPPDHPEMVCLQEGGHSAVTKYGMIGILTAIFWFPLGIGLCLLDRRVKCSRCGIILEDSMCHI